MNKLFLLKNGVVYRLWCEDGRTSDCVLVPEVLRDSLLMLAHDYSGHNGVQEDIQRNEEAILLARDTKRYFETLQEMSSMCNAESRHRGSGFRPF